MQKIFYLFIYFTLAFLNASSQVVYPSWAWGHNFNGSVSAIEYHNDYIYTAATFSDSSFIFGNVNITNQGNQDVVIMKWDTLGNLIWATSIWGTNSDVVVSIKVNANNELVVVGSSNSATINAGGIALTSNGGYDIYYAKYDLNGNILNAYIYGTANNEQAIDMCTDGQSNIYIVRAGNATKYNSSGAMIWQKSITATQSNTISDLSYSANDGTIVLCGSFAGTFTLDNYTINSSQGSVYLAKLSTAGSSLWLHNYYPGGYTPNMFVSSNGNIYVTCNYFGLSAHLYFFETSSGGTFISDNWGGIPLPTPYEWNDVTEISSISGRGDFVSLNYWAPMAVPADVGIAIYNITTHSLDKIYHVNATAVHIFREPNNIYTSAFSSWGKSLGKIGDGSLIGIPSNQTIEVCSGNLTTLTGNITGGIGPLTYSWLPVTGLNNTNTNTVNFTAVNNMSYTLTITDTAGQIAKDTFNIIVQNTIPSANITSQFPTFCDSMLLYSGNGIAGDWYQFMPANPPNNQWQLIAMDTIVTINAAGTYSYTKSNACNSVTDTIVIPGAFTVNANASSDSICAGQSVTLNGSGAVSYTWAGGVVNNIPFTPLSTQTYIVTGTDAGGCSNTSFVQITVLSSSNTTLLSICQNQIPYSWNGQSLDSTGTYTENYTNMYGCDSVEILNLTVSPCIVCVPSFAINYSPFYNALTESQTWITTSGTVLIEAGTNVKLDANANSYVSFYPGFKAEYGSVFVAQAFNGCTAGAPQLPQERQMVIPDLFSGNEIVLYPNPTSGLIHIKHDEKLTNIQIFDMIGKLIINQKCNRETETNIDLSNLPDGVYHVKAAGYNSIKVVKNNN